MQLWLTVIPVAILVLVAFVIGYVIPHVRHKQWEEAAAELDLWCDEADCLIKGERYGIPVQVDVEIRDKHSRNRHYITRYLMSVRHLELPSMQLRAEQKLLGINLDKMLKSTEIEVGFEAVDDALLINGPDKEAIRQFFKREGVGSAVLQCFRKTNGQVTYDNGVFRIERKHMNIDAKETLVQTIEALAVCGASFAKAAGEMQDERNASNDAVRKSGETLDG